MADPKKNTLKIDGVEITPGDVKRAAQAQLDEVVAVYSDPMVKGLMEQMGLDPDEMMKLAERDQAAIDDIPDDAEWGDPS